MADSRSGEARNRTDTPELLGPSERSLAVRGARLGSHGLSTSLDRHGLRVRNPQAAGCCDENPTLSDLITCRAFDLDGAKPWFFASDGTPITPAGDVGEAEQFLRNRLAAEPRNTPAKTR